MTPTAYNPLILFYFVHFCAKSHVLVLILGAVAQKRSCKEGIRPVPPAPAFSAQLCRIDSAGKAAVQSTTPLPGLCRVDATETKSCDLLPAEWNCFRQANSASPLSVTDSAIAASTRMQYSWSQCPPQKNKIIIATENARWGDNTNQTSRQRPRQNPKENLFNFALLRGQAQNTKKNTHPQCRSSTS